MDVLKLLETKGAVYTGEHFVYTSGKHGSAYVNLRPLYPLPEFTFPLARRLVDEFAPWLDENPPFDIVIGPHFGGNELAEMFAAAWTWQAELLQLPQVKLVRTRKRGKGFMVEPGRHYEQYLPGCRALVLDDVFTTGGSVKKVIRLVQRHGGVVAAVGGAIDRGGFTASTFGVEAYRTLENVPLQADPETDCRLCAQGVPIVENIGHGKKFKEAHPDYPGGFKLLG